MPAQTHGTSNGPPTRKFENGVYTPLITPMTDDEQVDLDALRKQVVRLAEAGMGLVLLGTNGEGEFTSFTRSVPTLTDLSHISFASHG
jgi:hypothetical protein